VEACKVCKRRKRKKEEKSKAEGSIERLEFEKEEVV